jgi:SAM-dependent methyltransferase
MKDWFWHKLLKNLKIWSRSGILEMIDNTLDSNSPSRILSVGGYGPVNQYLEKSAFIRNTELITLDIEGKHNPDILIDITECSKVISSKTFDVVVAIEVLEHVLDPKKAISECHYILKENGVLILSTPWIIPIHDRPFDYYRFTPQALQEMCKDFSSITIYARGDYFDSIVLLMLRGLFIKGRAPRIFLLIGTLISITSKKPKFYPDISSIDSAMGYFLIAKK